MIDASPDNPFVGLRPFRSEESLLFFGRRQQVTDLLKELYLTHFLGVVGSSGCGKSSLIQAGLIPRLTAGFFVENRDLWIFRTITPGDAPRARLAAAFDIAEEALSEQGSSVIVDHLLSEPDAASRNCFLLVDQFEEIFSHLESPAKRDEAADFVCILLALAAQQEFPIFVVLTMRSDFLGDCDMFHGLPEAINQSHYLVPRLTRPYRQEAIEGPARLFGQTFTPQLIDRVLNDLGDDQDQLPIMQHALLRTWERWRKSGDKGSIDVPHYIAVGGVSEALSRDADAALKEMSDEERQVAVRIFQALTDTDDSNRPVRRYVRLSELERETGAPRAAIERTLERFRESGRSFVVLRPDPESDDASVHISHESLIRQWGTLGDWVSQERDSRDQYLRLVDLARRHARNQEGLLRDPGLQLALDWRDETKPSEAWAMRYRDDFDLAMSFLDESAAQREKERSEKEAQQKLQLQLATEQGRSKARAVLLRWAFAFAIVGFVAAGVAIYQSRAARALAVVADSGRLALHARLHVERELDLAMLWSVEALRRSPTFDARSGLLSLIGRRPNPSRFFHGHSKNVNAVAFAPDGKLAASAGGGGEIVLWNPETSEPRKLPSREQEVQTVAFSPDGRTFAAGLRDGTVELWSLSTWEMAYKLVAGSMDVRSLAFRSDGARLATGTFGGSVIVWDLPAPGQPDQPRPTTVATSQSEVLSVAFSPDGARIATGHLNGSLMIWELANENRGRELKKHTAPVTSLAFSPDGHVLVSGSNDRTIQLWNARDANATAPIKTLSGQSAVSSIAIAPNSRLLVSGTDDGTIRVWDVAGQGEQAWTRVNERPVALTGHGSIARSVAFSPDSNRLISGGWDNNVILWDLADETLVEHFIRVKNGKSIEALEWSADGQSLVWSNGDQRASKWNLGTRAFEPVQQAASSESRVLALAFDRTGTLRRSALGNELLQVSSVETGNAIGAAVKIGHDNDVTSVALSRARDLMAYGTFIENEVVVWDLSSGRELRRMKNGKKDENGVQVDGLAFDPTATTLAVTQGREVVLWDLATGAEVRFADRDVETTVGRLAFSPDGKRLAVGSTVQREIFIWDVPTRRLLGVLTSGRRGVVQSLAFGPGDRLASGDHDGTIRVWNLSEDALERYACRTANRSLPTEEWSVILPGTPYHETCAK